MRHLKRIRARALGTLAAGPLQEVHKMELTKKSIIVLICFFICINPLINTDIFSYADNSGGGWTPISSEAELVAAFKAYCKTRNYEQVHEPSVYKQIVAWDYSNLEKLANFANVDLTSLNAHIWYAYNNNNLLKWYMDKTGCSLLNTLYSALLGSYNLSENQTKRIYSGKWFEDDDGNGCYVFELDSHYDRSNLVDSYLAFSQLDWDNYVTAGSLYKTTGKKEFNTMRNDELSVQFCKSHNITYTYYFYCIKGYTYGNGTLNFVSMLRNSNHDMQYAANNSIYYDDSTYYIVHEATPCIWFSKYNNKYYLGFWSRLTDLRYGGWFFLENSLYELTQPDTTNHLVDGSQGEETTPPTNKSLTIQTNDNSITNYITNNNTVNYNYGDDDNPPSDNLPTTPDYPTGTTIDPNGGISWSMPDIHIDWNLPFNTNNLPFPFSIPFDMIKFLQTFDSEPVTPHIEEDIEIAGMTIPIDIDLEPFDDVASYVRSLITALYVFALIIATRALFHIY